MGTAGGHSFSAWVSTLDRYSAGEDRPSPRLVVATCLDWLRPAKLGMDVPLFESEISPPLRDSMAEISWGEISCYLRDMLLRDSDCMSMAHSLELRVPFLDAPLVYEVLRLPAEVKYDPRFPKNLLLRAAKDILPEKSWNRPKMGFSFPIDSWMRRPLRDYCRQGLELAQGHLALNLRQTEIIWKRWEKHQLAWSKLWALVVLGHYLDTNDRP